MIAIATPYGTVSRDWIKEAMAGSRRFELVEEHQAWSNQAWVMIWQRVMVDQTKQ